MAVALYMDVHVPQAITGGLRRLEVDVVTAIEDSADELPDDALLARAAEQRRVLFTQDIRFKALAEEWQRQSRPFAGLIFGHQLHGTIGRYVKDLELVALASDLEEWANVIEHLPY